MYNLTPLHYGLFVVLAIFTSVGADSNTTISTVTVAGNLSSPSQIAEGGIIPSSFKDKTHLGREHVIETQTVSTTKILNNTQPNRTVIVTSDKSSSTLKPTTEKIIEIVVPKKNDEKKTVGKKGVNFTDDVFSKETSAPVTTTSSPVVLIPTSTKPRPVPKKPNVTVHDDYVPSATKTDSNPKISNIDPVLEKKSKSSNYVIPIVAVILSVPLVAIIISVIYKRGTDWWQHRNYRRMDFLIEGMYNN